MTNAEREFDRWLDVITDNPCNDSDKALFRQFFDEALKKAEERGRAECWCPEVLYNKPYKKGLLRGAEIAEKSHFHPKEGKPVGEEWEVCKCNRLVAEAIRKESEK